MQSSKTCPDFEKLSLYSKGHRRVITHKFTQAMAECTKYNTADTYICNNIFIENVQFSGIDNALDNIYSNTSMNSLESCSILLNAFDHCFMLENLTFHISLIQA